MYINIYYNYIRTQSDFSDRLRKSHILQAGVAVRVGGGYSAATALRSSSCWSHAV